MFACDASRRPEVDKLFADLDASFGAPDIVIYNASFRTRGPFVELDPADVEKAIAVTAYGAFLVAQQAARRMLPKKHGAILLTGASAGVKGYAQSAPFAMGKFALRGLAQSMARELSPQGIHVAHVVIDGGIRSVRREASPEAPDSLLDPDAIADTYMHLIQAAQRWAWEDRGAPWVVEVLAALWRGFCRQLVPTHSASKTRVNALMIKSGRFPMRYFTGKSKYLSGNVREREVPPLLAVGRKATTAHRICEQSAVLLRLRAHAPVRRP